MSREPMPVMCVHVTAQALRELDELVRRGVYPNRSEAVRAAIRELLYKESFAKVEERRAEEAKDDLPVLRGR